MATDDPSQVSVAYGRMAAAWQTVDDILAGPATIRAAGERYLPKYEGEDGKEYLRRLKCAPWQPEFADILQTLSAKPFSKEVALQDGASARVKDLAEDIDARGNNLTTFARDVFRDGIARGMHAILVDFPSLSRTLTQAEERQAGVRPYWVSIPATSIIALRTAFAGGAEVISHVRLKECVTEPDGFGEKEVERIRVLEPSRWELWEREKTQAADKQWVRIDEGRLTLPQVPLALFWTGRREGPHFVRPPLDALADKQIELYRALSRQDEILTYAGSPMLCAMGIAPPKGGATMEVGPKRILYAPPGLQGAQTGWGYIQPDAANIEQVREGIRQLVDDIRRLGMQPLTQKSGAVTATATSVEAAKAHSAVEAWALALKDCLEQAMVFTTQWLGEGDGGAEVSVHTDFIAGLPDQPSLDALAKARATKDISRSSYIEGLKRFGVLQADFDAEADEEELAEELEGLEPEEPIDPAGDPDPAAANAA